MEFQEIAPNLSKYLNGEAIRATISQLRNRANEADLAELKPIVDHVLNDQRFWLWPASKNDKHHAYLGGLALHVLEVVDFAKALRGASDVASHAAARVIRPEVVAPWRTTRPWRWLFVGCLLHDYWKTVEYHCTFEKFRLGSDDEKSPWRLGLAKVERSAAGRLQSHVTESAKRFLDLVGTTVAPGFAIAHAGMIDEVCHMIHAHHGHKAWGSPVTPKTYEALILHQADMLSVFHDTGTTPMERD